MRATNPSYVVASYPAAGTQDFYVSGYADGEEELGGTAAITDELWNALFGNDPWADVTSRRAAVLDIAAASASSTTTVGFNGIRLTVRAGSEATARAVLRSHGADYRVVRSAGKVSFLIASPGGAEGRWR
jgi:hypothetical protein